VHRQLAPDDRVLALEPDEHADLVRGWVDVLGERLALAGLHAGGVDDHDVLAHAGDEFRALALQRLERAGTVGLDGLERFLGEREKLGVLRDGLGLAADRGQRADVAGDRDEDDALRGLAAGALRRLRHAALAEELLRRLQVAARLLEGALDVHHPRAGLVAELLDKGRGDAHFPSTSTVSRCPTCSCSCGASTSTPGWAISGAGSGSGSAAGVSAAAAGSAGAAGASGSAAAAGSAGASGSAAGVGSACGRCLRLCGRGGLRLGCRLRLRRCGSLGLRLGRCRLGLRLLLLLLELLRRDALLARLDPVGDHACHERARPDRVVVARDDEVGVVRVAVRVDERDHRQFRAGAPRGSASCSLRRSTTKTRPAACACPRRRRGSRRASRARPPSDALLRREQLELPLLLAGGAARAGARCGSRSSPVRQQAAEPAVVHVRHADALGLLLDGVLRLLLRADEQHGAVALGDVADEVVSLLERSRSAADR
jgi:hypothetical protein